MILTHSSSPGVTTCSGGVDVVRGHLGDVHQTLDAVADLHEPPNWTSLVTRP